jgi:lysophospholipase L1-like esterase
VALAVAVLVFGAPLLTAGCSSGAEAPSPEVAVIGDSLTVGAQLGNFGVNDDWSIDAVTGRTTDEGVTAAKALDPAAYDQIVIALGTNDYEDTEAEYAARIDAMMAVLGSKVPVTWVNVDTGTPKLAGAAAGVNAALDAAADRYPNLTVADWDAYVAGLDDPDSLRAGDGVHYDMDGNRVRARWMEDLIRS